VSVFVDLPPTPTLRGAPNGGFLIPYRTDHFALPYPRKARPRHGCRLQGRRHGAFDHGATWSTPSNLSLPNPVQSFAGARDPGVGVDTSGKITVAWEDDSNGKFSGDNDIYIRTSTDAVTFSGSMDVSNTTDKIEVHPIIVETPTGKRYMTCYDMNGQQSNPVLSVLFYAVQ